MLGTGIDMKDLYQKLTVDIEAIQNLAAEKEGVPLDGTMRITKNHAKEVLVAAKRLKRVVWINQASIILVTAFNMIVVLSIVVAMNNLVSTKPLSSTWALPVMVTAVMVANVFAGRVLKEWVINRILALKEILEAKKKILEAGALASKNTSI